MKLERLKENKKAIIILILLLIALSVGISYAYWRLILQQTGENKIASSCLTIELIDESESIKMENAYPIIDEEGMQTTPYTFTIRNTCDTFIDYEVSLGMLETTTLKSEYIAAVLDYNEIKTLNTYEEATIDGYKEGRILQKGSLSQGDEVSYNLRLWMDEDVTINDVDSMNQTFEAKVVVTATIGSYSPVEQGFTTLADAMLVNEYQSSSVEDAKAMIASKQAPDFTKTAPIIDWQENHASNQATVTATMPHPDLVGNGEAYTANLTAENILPRIGTSYEFNSETGRYTVTGDLQYVDPTTLDYSNDYYYCGSGFNTNVSDLISPYGNYANCTTIYKITSATKEDGQTTGTGGTEIKTQIYRLTVYRYDQIERESDKSDRGLYTMEDADGTSYYYRGNVTNNYVLFGGYYWRIIRLNGDGSIRLLYAGETADATGNNLNMKLTDSSLGYTNRTISPFNATKTNPGYVGYMYGNTFNSSYAETNANENDSDIKKYLDSWYKQNIEDKGLSEYIADSGFCNDRSLSTSVNNGDGVQTTGNHTYYAGYDRYTGHSPILTCPNATNDLFTTNTSDTGNKALTYPIGLITVDELMLGGLSDGYMNRLSYTYSSYSYWTMSPSSFNVTNTTAYEFNANSVGYASHRWVTIGYGVRAVINLKSDVQISGGIGTANDPFVVQIT